MANEFKNGETAYHTSDTDGHIKMSKVTVLDEKFSNGNGGFFTIQFVGGLTKIVHKAFLTKV